MNLARLIDSIKTHEGYKAVPYRDHLGFWTVGFGHLIENTDITDHLNRENAIIETLGDLLNSLADERRHREWLLFDIEEAIQSAKIFTGDCYPVLNDLQREVIAEMAFQMGRSRLFTFTRFQRALKNNQFEAAQAEMLDSKWARQTPNRARNLADKILG